MSEEKSDLHPLVKERATQELAALLVNSEKKDLVSAIVYGIDSDGDFSMVLRCGSRQNHRYGVVVKIENGDSLTWRESRAVRAVVKFGERFTKMNDEEFKRFKDHLVSEDTSTVSLQEDSEKSVIVIKPNSVGRSFGAGRICQMKIAVDKDQDLVVAFQTDQDKYVVVINHSLKEESFADLETQAFADVVHIAEPGDKMDDHIFLHYMAKLRNKYHMLKVTAANGAMSVHIVPTQLSVAETGISFDSNVALPTATDDPVDWSPATQARVTAAQSNSGGENGGGSNGATAAQQLLQAAGLLNGASPLSAERITEEAAVAMSVAQHADIICKTYYGFDQDGDFSVIMQSSNRPGFKYIFCVKVADRNDIGWKECRAMRDVLQLGERGTKITPGDFTAWRQLLESKHKSARIIDGNQQQVILVETEASGRKTTPGRSRSLRLAMDTDKDFLVLFETDVQKYVIIVNHDEKENSFSVLQGKAMVDALLVGEPGDKMDDHMFMQYCRQLKDKYHLLKMKRQQGMLVAHIVPTALEESQAGVSFVTEIPFPAPVEKIEWSPETEHRVSMLHVGITCDVCKKAHFPGKRYKCLECNDYDLCHDCFAASRVSVPHHPSHSVRPMDPPGAGQSPPPPPAVAAASVHTGVTCDVCGKANFPGRRFNCLECHDYDLCQDCFMAGSVSLQHLSTHAIRPMDPPPVVAAAAPVLPPGLAIPVSAPPGLATGPPPGIASVPTAPPGLGAGNQNANA